MFQDESCKPIFGSQKVMVMSHKNMVGVGLCTPVSAGFF